LKLHQPVFIVVYSYSIFDYSAKVRIRNINSRAPIDQRFLRESSASLNFIGARSEHSVYDHLLIEFATHAIRCCHQE